MDRHFSLKEIDSVAAEFWASAGSVKIFAFYGEMGAGKTTLIHALCKYQAVRQPVSSPTYSIINEYEGLDRKIFHIDLYRLKDEDEAIMAGVEECFYSQHTCLVEWPERAPSLFPDDTVHVFLEPITEEIRRIRISGN